MLSKAPIDKVGIKLRTNRETSTLYERTGVRPKITNDTISLPLQELLRDIQIIDLDKQCASTPTRTIGSDQFILTVQGITVSPRLWALSIMALVVKGM